MPELTADVVVIGAGPGGYPAAIRAAQLGKKTVCIEREKLGGVCLNWGCIPSKALLHTAEFVQEMRHASDYGIEIPEPRIDYAKVIRRSTDVARKFERGVGVLFKKYGVEHMKGTARLVAADRVRIEGSESIDITSTSVIVATGARARSFPGIELDPKRVVTYREAIIAENLPESAVILGAGAIGIEFAYFWNALGVSVTVVEALDEILPQEDREIRKALRRSLEKQGIEFRLGTRVKTCRGDEDTARTVLEDGTELTSSTALVAVGIAANVENLGLEDLGVRLDRGRIAVDTSHRTNIAGVYAVGDCSNAGPALAHAAMRQAHVCVERIAGHTVPDVDYSAMPSCTYSQPQVASVGLTEEAARAKGLPLKVGRFPFQANGKAVGAGHPEGFVKVLLDEELGEILGAHIVGAQASEMIAEFVLARSSESTAELLAGTVHAHPTHAEAAMEAVAMALGVSVHL